MTDPHIYFEGVAVGINCGMYICWFQNATSEIIAAHDVRHRTDAP